MARTLQPGSKLVVATHNPGKLREIVDLLRPFQVDVTSAGALGLPEPDETASDFVGNARIKALAAARGSTMPALADVLSARWAGPEKDFSTAMARVHEQMGDAPEQRAWFVAALCLAWPDGATQTFAGRVDGETVWPPRGQRGFGYDPMFLPRGGTLTFGEMEPLDKHAVSHRARAFAQFVAACLG